jgi:CheY-like chemotaxis protein
MYSILIVDDDPVTKLLLRRILEQQGYGVETAQNGKEGIQKAEILQPALIICDWLMPINDGLEVCRFVKNNPKLCTTFFILLTSRGGLEDRIEGLNAGADEFLAKPIDMNELKARVRAGLRLHQLSQDLQSQKQALENELAEAANYVRSILPPPMVSPFQIETLFLPSRQLGGDCFDYFWLNPDTLIIYLLDVSGHGLGAALPSVYILNLLRSQSLSGVNYANPPEVLAALNRAFQMTINTSPFGMGHTITPPKPSPLPVPDIPLRYCGIQPINVSSSKPKAFPLVYFQRRTISAPSVLFHQGVFCIFSVMASMKSISLMANFGDCFPSKSYSSKILATTINPYPHS